MPPRRVLQLLQTNDSLRDHEKVDFFATVVSDSQDILSDPDTCITQMQSTLKDLIHE
ncbi:hypothetical protein ARMGADRAFT_815230 [Armillaria gallica]|uniref:Uncharacterized protein n=1 Tax=Armillaria gallica TaxID=47427 RepID=A0A2H3CRL5_ARMGA|nr:hypothetical protein ARMGADRAFT_815230 [Armillaria gallica]